MIERLDFVIADDDSDDRESIQMAFNSVAPMAVIHVFTDGIKAIEYLKGCDAQDLPCGIVLDYNMPIMNGPEVLDWLCGQPRMFGINKFVWSTDTRANYIDGCMGKGAIDYFAKPDSDEALFFIVRKIIDYCQSS